MMLVIPIAFASKKLGLKVIGWYFPAPVTLSSKIHLPHAYTHLSMQAPS